MDLYSILTEVYRCKDFSCDEITLQPTDLHFNDFVLSQDCYYQSYCNLYFTEVWYSRDGLQKGQYLVIDNSKDRDIKILLKADIAWNNFKITVISQKLDSISYSFKYRFRINEQGSGHVLIECIKEEQSEDCLTCQQQYEIIGFTNSHIILNVMNIT